MRGIILAHTEKYPKMQPTDAVKLIYQATFGGGHLIKNEQAVLEYLRREYAQISHSGDAFVCEPLGEVSRVYLGGELTDLELSLIAKMFCESAKRYAPGFDAAEESVKDKLFSRLDTLAELCREGHFSFTPDELSAYLAEYAEAGYPPVSHSDAYRKAYAPAYRVIDTKYVPLLPLIRKIASLTEKSDKRIIIAIDGRCASGKTTAAALIAPLFNAEIIHMDYFFLPPELRDNARLCEVGGNIHYERFADEVVPHLRSEHAFSHRVFDCSRFAYADTPHTVQPSQVLIIEGVYSLHPSFGKYYDIAAFYGISPEKQLERLKQRANGAFLERFKNEWIPMEERYFDTLGIRDKCDITI